MCMWWLNKLWKSLSPWLQYTNCVDHKASRMFYAISTAENMLIFQEDVCNTFSKALAPKQGFYLQPDHAFNGWWESKGWPPSTRLCHPSYAGDAGSPRITMSTGKGLWKRWFRCMHSNQQHMSHAYMQAASMGWNVISSNKLMTLLLLHQAWKLQLDSVTQWMTTSLCQ